MNFPKFMIRQTGGCAVGAISTRSRPASFAFASASAITTMPSASPSAPISRTSFQRICSLTRILFLSIFHLRKKLRAPRRDRGLRGRKELFDRQGARVPAVPQADGHGARRRLFLADDQHARDLGELGLADPRAELLVAIVDLHP